MEELILMIRGLQKRELIPLRCEKHMRASVLLRSVISRNIYEQEKEERLS
jgi:hypothetical protein